MSSPAQSSARPSEQSPIGVTAILEDGVLSGMLGAAGVALFFLVIDTLRGEPLATPNLLGSVLFRGMSVEEVTAIDMTVVFAYTGLHVLLFVLSGCAVAWIVSQFVANPQFGMVLVLLFLLFEAVLFGFEVTLVPALVGALGAWAVALANILAAVLMFWFVLNRHPEALARLRQGWNE